MAEYRSYPADRLPADVKPKITDDAIFVKYTSLIKKCRTCQAEIYFFSVRKNGIETIRVAAYPSNEPHYHPKNGQGNSGPGSLGLNGTQGVWVDQMEYVPLFLRALSGKDGIILKRDNPSVNLFFARLGDGWTPTEAFQDVISGGFLEPGAVDLAPEVKDQIIKLRVTANLCALLTGYSISTPENELNKKEASLLHDSGAEDLARWHLSGRRRSNRTGVGRIFPL